MKKLMTLLLAAVMVLSMAACAGSGNAETTETTEAPQVNIPASALEILENIWADFAEEEKFYVMGGDYNNPVDNAPGAVDVTMTDYLSYSLLVPEAQTGNVTEAASMMHGMLANNFTCGAFRVSDAAAFADAMHNAVANNPWMCGMPEKMTIAVIGGEYVLVAFGIHDAMNPFDTHLAAAYPDAQIVYNEAIAG